MRAIKIESLEEARADVERETAKLNLPTEEVKTTMAKRRSISENGAAPASEDKVARKIAGLLAKLDASQRKSAVKSANSMLKFAAKLAK